MYTQLEFLTIHSSSPSRPCNRFLSMAANLWEKPSQKTGTQPGGTVWVKRHHPETLESRWKGPYPAHVVLTTAKVVNVAGITAGFNTPSSREQQTFLASEWTEWTVTRSEHPFKVKSTRLPEVELGPQGPCKTQKHLSTIKPSSPFHYVFSALTAQL